MSAGLIDEKTALEQHLEHIIYPLVLLLADPNAKSFAPTFEALLERWWGVSKQETLCSIAILKAAARMVAADNTLDALVDELANTVLVETKNDRTAPLFVFYFAKPPYELRRPVLSSQLETMRAWIPSLKGSNLASLKLLGEKIEAAVKVADAAVEELTTATQQNREFRTVGERRKFVDDHNAARKSVDGALSEMPHKHPELKLPRSFANLFFKRVSPPRARVEDKPETSAELAGRIAELGEELDGIKKKYDEALLAEKTMAEQQAQHQADEEALEVAEHEVTQALAKRAAIKAKLGR